MRIRFAALAMALLMAAALAGCGAAEDIPSDTAAEELVLYCPHSKDFCTPIVNEFEQRYGIQVTVVNAGTVEFLRRIEEEKDDPQGDVLWGGTISTVSTRSELFEDYVSVNDQFFPEEYRNTEGNMTRFTYIISVLMVNTDLTGDIEITGYESLLNPELKGKIAAADPAMASSGKEHMVNMLYAIGGKDPEAGWDYVGKFCENLDGRLLDGSSAVYTSVANGEYAVGLSFEEGASNYVGGDMPIEIVYMEEGVIGKPDGVYIIKGAEHRDAARKFVDFLTGEDVQTMVAEQLNRRPLRTDVAGNKTLPSIENVLFLQEDPELVAERTEIWTQHFLDLFYAAAGG